MIVNNQEMRLEEIATCNRATSHLQRFLCTPPAETSPSFFQSRKQLKRLYLLQNNVVAMSVAPLIATDSSVKYLPGPMKFFLRERLLQIS